MITTDYKDKNVKHIFYHYFFILILAIVLIYEILYLFQLGVDKSLKDSAGISIKILSDLAKGSNPYGKEWLFDENALPVTYWESGFFHILPSLLLIKIFGISPIASTAIMHIVYVLSAMGLMATIVYKMTSYIELSMLSSCILYFCLNPKYVDGIRPDTLCTVLIMLIVYNILADKKYFKEWIISFSCILLIFLKIHYASVLVAIYIVEIKNKRWIQFTIKNIIIGIAMLLMTILFFPTFISTFGIRIIQMFVSNNTNSDYIYMLYQWKELFVRYAPIIIVLLIGSCISFRKIANQINKDIYLFLFTNIIVNIIGLCYMGKWSGNFLAYHNVMIMPMIIICSMPFLAIMLSNKRRINYFITAIVVISTIILLVRYNNTYHIHKINFDPGKHTYNEWIEMNKDKEMLLSPSCAQFAYDNDYYLWDWGDQIYLPYDIGTSPKWNALFPYTNQYRNKNIDYANSVMAKILNKEYSLIVSDDYNEFGHKIGMKEDFWIAIESNYELVEKDNLVGYWIPKGE